MVCKLRALAAIEILHDLGEPCLVAYVAEYLPKAVLVGHPGIGSAIEVIELGNGADFVSKHFWQHLARENQLTWAARASHPWWAFY